MPAPRYAEQGGEMGAARSTSCQLSVQRQSLLGHRRDVVFACDCVLGLLAQVSGEAEIREDLKQFFCQVGRVVGFKEEPAAGRFDHLGKRAVPGKDYGNGVRHGFEGGEAFAFSIDGGGAEDV